MLVLAQPGACGGAQNTVRGARVKALGVQRRLQLPRLLARQGLQVTRPFGHHARAAAQALRQQRHGQRVVGGIVVAQDGAEVLPHQKCRAPCTGGRQDGGRGQVGQGGVAVHGAHPFSRPLGSALPHAQLGPGVVKARWQLHLSAPGFTGHPAFPLQKMRGRCRHVGDAAPDVAAPVAIGVHRVGLEHRGNELRVPHGPGPGADHGFCRNVAPVNDAQRCH